MPHNVCTSFLKIARGNIRHWSKENGRPGTAEKLCQIVTIASRQQYRTVADLKAYLQSRFAAEVGTDDAHRLVKTITGNFERKKEFIRAYFEEWKQDLDRARSLLTQEQHYLDAWLVLSCYIGAITALRYPFPAEGRDRAKYQFAVLKYSGLRHEYEKIDLLFLLQWKRSEYANDRRYEKVRKHYASLRKVVVVGLGTEEKIQSGEAGRYVSCRKVTSLIHKSYRKLSPKELREAVSLFSVLELLYRHVRNQAVHERRFPLVTRICSSGSVRYEDNHLINGDLLVKTVSNMLQAIEAESLKSVKFPHELRQTRKWR